MLGILSKGVRRKALVTSPAEKSFGNYRVLVILGRTNRLILSFASRGESIGMSRFEWRSTFERANMQDHIIYVRDVSNSWYASAFGWQDFCGFVEDFKKQYSIIWSAAMGLSMGGYGALVFASSVQIDRVVALAPQTCIKNRALFDFRFQADWQNIKKPTVDDTSVLDFHETELVLCVPCDDLNDVLHSRVFAGAQKSSCELVLADDHHFSQMHAAGALDELLHWLLSGENACKAPHASQMPEEISAIADSIILKKMPPEKAVDWYFGQSNRSDKFIAHSYYNLLCSRLAGEGVSYLPARTGANLVPNGAAYLVNGWHDPEPWGCWSASNECLIRLRIANRFSRALLMELEFTLVEDLKCVQKVIIKSNSGSQRLTQRIEIVAYRGILCKLAIPVDGDLCEIAIETPDAASPFDRSGKNDHRTLGVGLVSLKVVQACA